MADESKENEEKSEQPAREKKKKSPMMLIIIIAAALVIGGGGAVAFLMLQGGSKEASNQQQKGKKEKQEKPGKMGPVIPLDSFIVNLAGGGGTNYLKIEISIELNDEKLTEEINNKVPKIRDAILLVLSTKTYEDIKTSQGKLILKDELLTRLNSYLNTGSIVGIYFTSFVVQ